MVDGFIYDLWVQELAKYKVTQGYLLGKVNFLN